MTETKLSKNQAGEGIWTADNLIAGTDISITQVPQPLIDENTICLWHLDDDVNNTIEGGNPFFPSASWTFSNARFGKGLFYSSTSTQQSIGFPNYSNTQNFTLDFWFKLTQSNQYFVFYTYYNASQRLEFYNTYLSLPGSTVSTVTYPSGINVLDWTHFALVNDYSSNKTYYFINGIKFHEASSFYYLQNGALARYGAIDEVRVSNVVRWTSDFTPFTQPYAASAGPTQYAINNTKSDPDLSSYLKNTATGTDSLTIAGQNEAKNYAVNIGNYSRAAAAYSVAVGACSAQSDATIANENSVAIGYKAKGTSTNSTVVGYDAQTISGSNSVAIGVSARANASNAVALGASAQATANNAIQIGKGTNNEANTLRILGTKILESNGKIAATTIDGTAYTYQSLVPGDNVTFTQVDQPIIDQYVTHLWHCENNTDSVGSTPLSGSYNAYTIGKFNNAVYCTYATITGGTFNLNSNFTWDAWMAPYNQSSNTSCGIGSGSGNRLYFYGPNDSEHANKIILFSALSGTGSDIELDLPSSIEWQDNKFFHVAYEVDYTNSKVYLFVNGKKLYEGDKTVNLGNIQFWYQGTRTLLDEIRTSSIVRWTEDFTPFQQPYSSDNPAIYKINANIETNIIRTSDVEQSNILPMIPGNLDSIRKAGIYSIILSVDQQGFTVELPYRLDVVSYSYMGASMACMQYLSTKILNSNITLQRSDEGDGQGFGSWKVSELPPSSEYYSGITGTTLNISSICDYEDLIHPSMISVYKNGAKLYPDGLDVTSSDIQYDYSITGKTITFHTPLIPSDLIEVRYS